VKHIKENCMACGVELTTDNWYPSRMRKKERNCIPCHDIKRLERKIKQKGMTPKMLARLFQMKHESDYSKIKEGFVYILTNPAWEGWLKIGMAIDAEDRRNSYQTSSPLRDYILEYKKFFTNRSEAEQEVHKLLINKGKTFNGEWFQVSVKEAKKTIEAL